MSMITDQIVSLRKTAEWPSANGALKWTLRDAADTIEELSAKLHASQTERSSQYYHGGWIPVKERLPEKSGDYLVTIKATSDNICYLLNYRKPENYWTEKDISKKSLVSDDAIAWRPLPEPYSPNEEEADHEQMGTSQ